MLTFKTWGSGEPLLLIHGLGGSARSGDLVREELQRRLRLIVVNLSGHGGVPVGPEGKTISGLVRRVEAFLRDEGLNECDVVGCSLGGRIVLKLARRGPVGRRLRLIRAASGMAGRGNTSMQA
ncbi:alpha/beta fold hydrolase [Neorhizobium sp. 2083]|uniref:alpha/beta fold hydrolase n=1 Tax=Neorhizobium sp. 2083 TaxID=2817762 RepID=UPI00286ABC2D|nr:alpha/beta fold hydrolase [Neorhizobium sp. 2083]